MKYFLYKIYLKKFYFVIFTILFFSIPSYSQGATISISPLNKEVRVGETFNVSVISNSSGTAINAASLDIKYDPAILSIQSINRANSIFKLWTEEPSYSNITGLAHFSGGLSSPGWNGTSGNLVTITFKSKSTGQTKIMLQNGSVLANDGIGTNVLKSLSGSDIKIIESVVPKYTQESTKTEEIEINQEEDIELSKIPLLENVPDKLEEGDTLSFNGKTLANEDVQVYIQKGKDDIEITQINTKEDGKFNVIYKNPVSTGYYKVWARAISKDGILSDPSELFYIEVVKKTHLDIFGFEITYNILVIILSIISFLLFITLVFRISSEKISKNYTNNQLR